MKPFRGLKDEFLQALLKEKVRFILQYEKEYRKSLIVEIRNNYLDLYFLGHAIQVKHSAKKGYYLSASKAFNPDSPKQMWQVHFDDIKDYPHFKQLMKPVISRIVIHKSGNISEGVSELNHFVDNRAIGKNGVLVIDRQVVYPGIKDSRIDLLGIARLTKKKNLYTFYVIELKNRNNTEIGQVFTQTSEYIDLLYDHKEIYESFRNTYMTVIDQKIQLGLLKKVKCDIAPWDNISKQDIKGVVILDNFNIKGELKQTGLLQRALHNWGNIPKTYNIDLFLKTNVLDSTFFMDINKTKTLLRKYKRCNS